MGQFDSIGLKPVGRIGLSESDRGRGLPERDREDRPRPGTTVVTKKKDKLKTASAGGGANPPKPPKKGPTGGDNKGPKDSRDYKMNKDNDKSMGSLTKSRAGKKEDLMNPRDAFKRKK